MTAGPGKSVPPPQGPILLLGGGGMLGRAWRELLARRGVAFDAPPRAEFDLLSPSALMRVTEQHRAVVNCAGWTDVDAAEAQPQEANRLNGEAVGRLAERCAAVGATLVHYSTDYVFQGEGTPIPVGALREPINAYGRSKAIGEAWIERFPERCLLIRTSWLYAPWGKNFVRTVARLAREKPSLRVVHDQRGRPTSAEHLAAASLALLERGAGTFHATDGGECTWFDFATEIARSVNPACRIEPCTTAEFPRPAARPAYSVLDLAETERRLGPMPDWRTNLADVLRRLE